MNRMVLKVSMVTVGAPLLHGQSCLRGGKDEHDGEPTICHLRVCETAAAMKAHAAVPGLLWGSPDKPRAESSWTGGNNQLSGQEISVFVEGK